jgi:hypothetical protein
LFYNNSYVFSCCKSLIALFFVASSTCYSLLEANQHLEKRGTAQKARIANLEGDLRKLKDNLQV